MRSKLSYNLIVRLGGILILFVFWKCNQLDSISYKTFEQLPKIDIHSHYKYSREYLPEFLNKWNMKTVLVDVALEDEDSLVRNFDNYLDHYKEFSQYFFLCTTFTAAGIENPDFIKKTLEQLQKDLSRGATMVKVWKNFGMVTQDSLGNYIMINDERLNPIWDFLVEKNIPVIAHIGDPKQAWRPLKDPNNPHYNYYKNNPEYHAYNFPNIPSYEQIIHARDQWVQKNPNLKIIAAHLASMANNISEVALRLDNYPNLSVELGARFGDLAMQDSKAVNAFFERYQNRILFGTDFGNSKPDTLLSKEDLETELNNLDKDYQLLFNYLVKSDSIVVRNQKTKGLGLSENVLAKIFSENFFRILEN